MNQKTEKAQKKLQETKLDRERLKARYDAHVTILEGHRANIINLEKQNNEILNEWKMADQKVVDASNELKRIIDEINDQQNEAKRESVQ